MSEARGSERGPVPPARARALARLGEEVAARAGLAVPAWVLDARVQGRVHALGLASAASYVDLVGSAAGAGELELLLDSLLVGETRFFRHDAQVSALMHDVAPALAARRGRGPVRVWSAGCASGEEAYTLAMVLSALLPPPRFQVSVLATDLSARALEIARRGEYPASALAHVPARWRDAAFEPASGGSAGRAPGRVRVAPAIARLVRFERRNLLLGPYPRDIDVLWCRNVFIYFTAGARARVLAALARSLSADGVLFLGHSERLGDIGALEPVRTPHAVLYRRRAADPARAPFADPARDVASRPVADPARDVASQPVTAGHAVVRLHGRYEGEARLAQELAAAVSGGDRRLVVELDGATLLDDGAAVALRRAASAARAAGVDLVLRAERPGTRRWLRRHGLCGGEP